jgi:hypothetical protein
LKLFRPYRCVTWFSSPTGRLIIVSALNGHYLTQRLHPIHIVSEIIVIFDVFETSIHILPVLFTGHVLAHSSAHLFGLHLSELTIAIRCLSVSIFC